MAGTFTRSIFYKLATSSNAIVEYTGVLGSPQLPGGGSPSGYRITNQAAPAGSTTYSGGLNALYTVSPTNRTISPTGGGVLSPTWPTVAGNSVTIWVQESIGNNGYVSPATSSASVLAITNPAVSGTQTFATTAAATISHSPALSTTGAGGTLQYNATTGATYSSSGWTSGTSPVILTRGTTYYLWARRGIGITTDEGAFAVSNGPFTVPYLSPNLTLGTVSPNTSPAAPLTLTGGDTSNVSVNWTAQANHTYRIIRNDLASPALVVSEVSSGPQSLLFSQSSSPVGSPNSGLVDLPLEGVSADYTIQVKRSVASGGDGLWYDGTATNTVPIEILRIKEPTLDDTQDFNSFSPTPISHTVSLKLNGLGGTLEYGWNTTGSPQQSAVTNWQSSATFANAFSRGSTYYFYARRSTDAADFDVSTAQTVIPLATYGLKVWNNAGTKVVFDTSTLVTNFITCKISGTAATSSTIAGSGSVTVTIPGITASNTNVVYVVVDGPYQYGIGPSFSVTRNTGSITITNTTASSITVYFYAGRYK